MSQKCRGGVIAGFYGNSIISITETGQTSTSTTSSTGLQCITDRRPCCLQFEGRAGEWYFLDRTTVPPKFTASTFYRNRGDDGEVDLNRVNVNVMMPTGIFCCEVLDAANVIQSICANIGESLISYSISAKAESYCSGIEL